MKKNEPKHVAAERIIMKAISQCDVDDKIPGERIFAKDLGISYMTARKAVDKLVEKGVLYRIPKKGTFVADPKAGTKEKKSIGYFLDNSIKEGLSSPYYSMIFNALEKEAAKNDYALVYFSDINDANSVKRLKQINGVIVSCFPRIEDMIQTINRRVPIICIDNKSSDKTIPSVTIDNFNAVIEATAYLCSLGHTRIGFITGLHDSNVGNDRLAGYLGALSNCGIDEDTNLIYRGDYSFETGAEGARHLLSLDEQPTAIICANDTMAIGAKKAIGGMGLTVPADISLVGFDDINVAAQISTPLTTLAAPVEEIAHHCLALLKSMMDGGDPDNRHISLPAPLVVRDSCAAIDNIKIAASKKK
ncbi:MAG: GntR family transcriptional regulator [Gammaproteobacteria bacterium]